MVRDRQRERRASRSAEVLQKERAFCQSGWNRGIFGIKSRPCDNFVAGRDFFCSVKEEGI